MMLLLAGCFHCPPKPDPQPQKFSVDERLLEECKPLGDLESNPKPSDVLKRHGADVLIHKDCMDTKRELVGTVRKLMKQGI